MINLVYNAFTDLKISFSPRLENSIVSKKCKAFRVQTEVNIQCNWNSIHKFSKQISRHLNITVAICISGFM